MNPAALTRRALRKLRPALGAFRVYRNPFVRFLDYFGFIRREEPLQIALKNGLVLRIRAGTSDFAIADDIFNYRVYDKALAYLTDGHVVIDIGAHVGTFALAAAARGARVLCFEPLRENVELLNENARLNGYERSIISHCLAAAGAPGTVELFMERGNTGGSTRFPSIHPGWESNGRVSSITVPCVTLHDILQRYDLKVCDCLKMDCEGAEFEILQSAAAEDLRRIRMVILEYHPLGDIQCIKVRLEDLGFVVHLNENPCILFAARPALEDPGTPTSRSPTVGVIRSGLNSDEALMDILCCPKCRGGLSQAERGLACRACDVTYGVIDGIPVFASAEIQGPDVRVNALKWKEFWEEIDWEAERETYVRANLPHIYSHMGSIQRSDRILELGSGPSYLSFDLASKGLNVVSIDLDISVLRKAKEHFSKHGREGRFVQGSIYCLPFRERVFDASVGIGVLEHVRDIEIPIRELFRVTKDGGYTFQTIPHLSFTTFLASSIRFGTIPHLPVLEQLVSLVHMKILGMRFMRYGYEESYTYGFLEKMFRRAGFASVDVGFYDYNQTLLRNRKQLAPFFYRLIRMRLVGLEPFSDVAYARSVK